MAKSNAFSLMLISCLIWSQVRDGWRRAENLDGRAYLGVVCLAHT